MPRSPTMDIKNKANIPPGSSGSGESSGGGSGSSGGGSSVGTGGGEAIEQPIDNAQAPPDQGQVAKITLPRLPPFFRGRPQMWFMQVDLMFRRARITSDVSKFEEVACQLEQDILFELEDFFTGPAADLTYENLKNRIIAQHTHSETKRIQMLLQELQLEDKKPSALLREMRSNAGTIVTDEFLKNLWMQRLPQQMQSILSIHTGPLNELAVQADKIAEVNGGPSAFAVSAMRNQVKQAPSDEISELRKMVASLLSRFNQLTANGQRQSRSKSRGNKSRDASRSPSRQQDGKDGSTLCFYHERFGEKATKCRSPCKFQKN